MLEEPLGSGDEARVRAALEERARIPVAIGAARAAISLVTRAGKERAARWLGRLALDRAASANDAIHGAVRALEGFEGDDLPPLVLERASLLWGLGGAPGDSLAAHPEDLATLGDLSIGPLPGRELPVDERLAALRRLRRRHGLAVAGAELSGTVTHDEAARLLSDAADALLDGVLEVARDRVPAARTVSLAVLALGKLGGRELNYSSDVDLVLVRGDDDPVAPTESLARAFVRALEELPEEGRLYRVDLRLRPEGSTGALAPRLASAVEYYAHHARTWERQAFLKARAAAGDRALGERFLDAIGPFLWETRLDARAIEEILGLRARIEARAGAEAERNVKEGPGGIRDVEYSVQFLQLLHGKAARATGTLEAIERLEAATIVRPDEARALRESYGFLRRIEHALQLTRDRELKQVPADAEARARLARALGLDLQGFDRRLAAERARARGTLDVLLRRPFGAAPPPQPSPSSGGEGASPGERECRARSP